MEEFETPKYKVRRKRDESLQRFYGAGRIEDELTVEQHQFNVDYHAQALANAEAQIDKVMAFECLHPAPASGPGDVESAQ